MNAEEIHFWFQNITQEDIEAVTKEIDAEMPAEREHSSKVQSMLQRIRERMRGSEGTVDESPMKAGPDKDAGVDSENTPSE